MKLFVKQLKSSLIVSLFLSLKPVFASSETTNNRYSLIGDTLVFDMSIANPKHEFSGSLELYDSKNVAGYLFEHPEIRTLRLTGPGGSMPAARELSKKILEFNLDTVAFGLCASACARVFIAGNSRSIESGAALGFHRQWIDAEKEKNFYKKVHRQRGWKDEFEYLSWRYDILVDNLLEDIQFMKRQGIDDHFTLRVLNTQSEEIWFPTREELWDAGIINK